MLRKTETVDYKIQNWYYFSHFLDHKYTVKYRNTDILLTLAFRHWIQILLLTYKHTYGSITTDTN